MNTKVNFVECLAVVQYFPEALKALSTPSKVVLSSCCVTLAYTASPALAAGIALQPEPFPIQRRLVPANHDYDSTHAPSTLRPVLSNSQTASKPLVGDSSFGTRQYNQNAVELEAGSSDTSLKPSQQAVAIAAALPGFDKGKVQDQVRDLSDTLKRIHHTSGEVYAEVNRHEMISTGPDYLDQMVMDPWMSAYPGLNPTGAAAGFQNTVKGPLLPPRKKYLDVSMAHLQQLISILDADVSSISTAVQAAGANADALKAQMLVASDAKSRIDAANQKLVSLTKDAPYDNKAISAAAEDIKDDVLSINEVRKRVAKLIDR